MIEGTVDFHVNQEAGVCTDKGSKNILKLQTGLLWSWALFFLSNLAKHVNVPSTTNSQRKLKLPKLPSHHFPTPPKTSKQTVLHYSGIAFVACFHGNVRGVNIKAYEAKQSERNWIYVLVSRNNDREGPATRWRVIIEKFFGASSAEWHFDN